MQRWRRILAVALLFATGTIFARSGYGSTAGNLSSYAYEDTRRLVAFVEEAAKLMEEKGDAAFVEFGRKGSKWFNGPYYLFVYAPDGTCVFHPLQPDWVGKNMSELRDMNGKPMVQLVAQVGEMIMSGLQIILSSKPDTRKTFVIGIPLIFGLSLQALPELYAQIVPWLRPLFGSALTLATVLAVVLNLLLRVGGTKAEATSAISGEG